MVLWIVCTKCGAQEPVASANPQTKSFDVVKAKCLWMEAYIRVAFDTQKVVHCAKCGGALKLEERANEQSKGLIGTFTRKV